MSLRKENKMYRRIIIAVLSMAAMAATSAAQTTGTITVNGSNPAAVSITNVTGGTLSATVTLGALTPAAGGVLTTGPVEIRMRSSKNYVLSAQATALNVVGLGTVAGGDNMSPGDIGFGITALDNTGGNVANPGGRVDTVVPLFDYTGGLPTVTNGLTPFIANTHGTLNDIQANTQILSGPRIS